MAVVDASSGMPFLSGESNAHLCGRRLRTRSDGVATGGWHN